MAEFRPSPEVWHVGTGPVNTAVFPAKLAAVTIKGVAILFESDAHE
jgi:hypothetical protein